MSYYRACIFLLLTALHTFVNAQFYPVQSTPQLVPPYSVYLSDYATPGNEKLRVILLQRDLTHPSYQLRLVMSVELNGKIIMRTSRAYNPPPISLSPGIPTVIAGNDLASYLDSRNIDFVGYSKEQYEKNKALPEGSYQIIFTAYDYHRQDVQVSNAGGTFYYLAKSEPPLITLPACGSRVVMRTPQQLVFSWLPRNTSSPNSAADTEYQLELFETRPPGRNPNDIVLSTQPVFKTLLGTTQYVYTPADPILLENMTYVWRVRAIDRNGKDAFRNNGYSEVCTFVYGSTDPDMSIGVVKNLQAQGEGERKGRIWWDKGDFESYRIYYRKTGEGYEWFFENVTKEELEKKGKTNGEVKLFDLEPDTEYETRVQGKKNGYFGNYTDVVKFRTPPHQVAICGSNSAKPYGDMTKPSPNTLIKGSIVQLDDMEMTLLDVTPLGDGWYKGLGKVTVDFLGGGNFAVKFDRLFIDEDRVAGYGRVDYISRGMAEMILQQAVNAEQKAKEQIQQQNRDVWVGTDFYDKIISYDVAIDTITAEGIGYLNITDSKGNATTNAEVAQILLASPDKAIIIQDKNGDQFVVQKEGDKTKVTKVPGGGLQPGTNESTLIQKIIIALKKYQKAIDDYQASIKQPGKGGGPSLFAWELKMFLAELPECLAESKDQLETIKMNLVALVDSASTEFGDFKVLIRQKVDNDATQEEVDAAVCEALVEDFFSKEQSILLLSQIHEANKKQEKQLDIVGYSGGKGLWQNYSLEGQQFQFLSVKIYSLPVTSTIRTMLISPPEIYKDNIKTWNNNNGDFTKFTFHESGMSDRSGPVAQAGKILLEVVVNKTEETKLENYLFNGNVRIQLYEADKPIAKGAITYISNEPRMPDIKVKSLLEKGTSEMKLVIVDSLRRRYNGANLLVRADVSYYPDENTWQTIKAGDTWTVDFGNDFRGGKVYLIHRANKVTDTTTFYIRGRNPTQAQVQAFLASTPGGNAWYFVKLIRHESNTLTRGEDFKHFNPGDAGTANNSSGGRPSWGPPYGWGLMQLDNLGTTLGTFTAFNSRYGPSADELWNWQANIRKGIQFFNSFKLVEATNRWNAALVDIRRWNGRNPNLVQEAYPMLIDQSLVATEINTRVNSIIAGDEINNETIVSDPEPNVHTYRILRDAFAIKFYNGGTDYFSLVIPLITNGSPPEPPYWKIDKTQYNGMEQHDYVDILCSRPGW